MWEIMNGLASSVRNRVMPRRKNGMGTLTTLVIGASVGIAAYETLRRTQMIGKLASPAMSLAGLGSTAKSSKSGSNSSDNQSHESSSNQSNDSHSSKQRKGSSGKAKLSDSAATEIAEEVLAEIQSN